MKKLIIATLVMGVALLGLQAQASANLLTDPSFESYIGPWTPLGQTDIPWYGMGGSGIPENFEIGGGAGVTNGHAYDGVNSALLYQYGTSADGQTWSYAVVGEKNITESIYGNTVYTASVFAKKLGSIANAQAYVKIKWYNSMGGLVSEASGASQLTDSDPTGTWISLSDNFTSPETAAKARFEVVFDRTSLTAVDPADIVVDAAGFDVIPEPATMLLFGSGLVGLFGFSRRKRS